jgi:site-specific recombinase XerD
MYPAARKRGIAVKVDQGIAEFLDYLEVEKGLAPLTVKVYRHYLGRFSQWLGESHPGVEAEGIELDMVRRYRLHLARLTGAPDGVLLKKITQSYHIVALRAFLRYLIVQRGVETLAPEKIDLPKATQRTVAFLNQEQVQRLLNCPDTSTVTGLRDRAILETLFSTGLRVSELARLDRNQVDLQRKEFGVIGKGSKPRVVFLSEDAVDWIKRYLESRTDMFKPLFIRYSRGVDMAKGGEKMRLTPRSIEMAVARYSRLCGIAVKATPHTLRHSFATDLLSAGADIRSVQEMLGHESIRTTQVYTHVTDRQLKEVHRAFHARRNRGETAPPAE